MKDEDFGLSYMPSCLRLDSVVVLSKQTLFNVCSFLTIVWHLAKFNAVCSLQFKSLCSVKETE